MFKYIFFIVYVHYLCLFAHSGLQHILCCVFYLFYFVLCTLCCQFLWLVLFISCIFDPKCNVWRLFLLQEHTMFITFYEIYNAWKSNSKHISLSSTTVCVVFFICSTSSCVPYVANFSGLSCFLITPSVFSLVYLICLIIFCIYHC
jgi:hypothetical protein